MDGWVSLEVSPLLAYDAESTVSAAKALHEQAGKPPIPTPPPTSAAAVTPTPTPMPTPKPPAGGSAAGSADVTLAAQRSALVTELGALEREVAALAP